MILSFSLDSFVEKIKSGAKIHTIRRNVGERWKVGNKIHFWKDNPRHIAKNPYCFGTGKVIRVNPIAIRYFRQPENSYSYARGNKFVEVTMNGAKLTRMECEELAQNDGFGSFEEFLDWFDSDFNGSIIFWSNFEEQNHE
jgi:tRNA G37 N-methylase TrmD